MKHQISSLHHVQLAMPEGMEQVARDFYAGVLGIPEVLKPPDLAKRGGVWFEAGSLRVHLGIESPFRPARKAHPALAVENLRALRDTLSDAGVSVTEAEPLDGVEHIYVDDPFGNRIELIEIGTTLS